MSTLPHPGLSDSDQPATVRQRLHVSGGGVVLVTGLQGVGKSVWCRQFTASAGRTKTVAVVADSIEHGIPSSFADKLARALTPTEADPAVEATRDPLDLARLLVAAVHTRRPGVDTLVVDNVQWIDPVSALALRLVLSRIGDEGLTIVLAGFTGAGDRMMEHLLGGRDLAWGITVRVAIPTLSASQIQQYVDHVWNRRLPRRAAEQLAKASGGLPLLIDASTRRLPERADADAGAGAPGRDRQHPWHYDLPVVTADRNPFHGVVADISDPATRRAVEYVCLLRDPAAESTVDRMAVALGEEVDLAGALRLELVRADVSGGGRRVAPWHDLVAAAVLDALPRSRANALHRAAAEATEEPNRRLLHLLAVDEIGTPEVFGALERQVDAAVMDRRWELAGTYLRLAQPRFPDERPRLLLELGVLAITRHAVPAVLDLLPEIEELPPDPVRDFVLMGLHQPMPETRRTLELAGELLSSDLDHPDADLLRSHASLITAMGVLVGDPTRTMEEAVAEGLRHLEGYRAQGRIHDPRLRHLASPDDLALQLHGFRLIGAANVNDVAALLEALGALGELIDTVPDSAALADALTCRAGFLVAVGDPVAATPDLERSVAIAASVGGGLTAGHSGVMLAACHILTGRLTEARLALADAAARTLDANDVSARPLLWWADAWLAALTGHAKDHHEATRRARAARITEYDTFALDLEGLAMAEFARTQGRRDLQLSATERQGEPGQVADLLLTLARDPEAPLPEGTPPAILGLATHRIDALAALGRAEEADQLLTLCRRYAGVGWWPTLGAMEWLEGRVAHAFGLTEQAATHYRKATRTATLPMPLGLAWLDLARLHLEVGDRRPAVAAANNAARVFRGTGATAYLVLAQALLDDQPTASPNPSALAFDRLTAREREIAHLGERGFTNAEIAAKLFVSAATVNFHMRNVLAKLGLSSRRELGRVLDSDDSRA